MILFIIFLIALWILLLQYQRFKTYFRIKHLTKDSLKLILGDYSKGYNFILSKGTE